MTLYGWERGVTQQKHRKTDRWEGEANWRSAPPL
jgi:hypothetical protein